MHSTILHTTARTALKQGLLKVLAFLCVCSVCAHAEKMNASIQEAIYRFEMKGETAEAIRILEKVTSQGDREDRETAYFYLGKIRELFDNQNSANFYYQQSLANTKETSKAYWLSEREASTSSTPEALLKKSWTLHSPIAKAFRGTSTYLLLQNGSVKKVVNDTIIDVRVGSIARTRILHIDDSGIWYQNESGDSLLYRPLSNKLPSRAYPIAGNIEFYSNGDEAIVQNENAVTLLNKKGISLQINDKYRGCHIEGRYSPTSHYILNCPDNALHFISDIDGAETYTISLYDAIQKVLVQGNDIVLFSGGILYCFEPKAGPIPRWKLPFNNIEQILPFENNFAVLEASGRISLIEHSSGILKNVIRSDAASIYPLAQGTIGLFTNEGSLTAVDTLLIPLWHFNFARPISAPPIHTDESIFLVFKDTQLQGIAPHYYGKRPLQSDLLTLKVAAMAEARAWKELTPLLDSLLKLEPGNAEAWLYRALLLESSKGSEKERQKAWSEAVRLSISSSRTSSLVLDRYSKTINAKFVSLLAISPKTIYPQFFGNKKNLYTVDPAAEKLICINAATGEQRWSRTLEKMTNSPVMANDDVSLALSSGYNLSLYDLEKDVPPQSFQLPGKAFSIQLSPSSIYVSTWNGFLLKINRSEYRLAWSRKIFTSPFLFALHDASIYTASLDGDIRYVVENSGQPLEIAPKRAGSISFLVQADSAVAVATDNNRIFLYSASDPAREPAQILLEASIVSLQSTGGHDNNILVGLADQSILLYSPSGSPLWKYQGRSSVFTKPFISGSLAWIDQGSEVIALSLKDGTVAHRFNTPGGAGTPFVMNRTLYSASPKRLLYSFSL